MSLIDNINSLATRIASEVKNKSNVGHVHDDSTITSVNWSKLQNVPPDIMYLTNYVDEQNPSVLLFNVSSALYAESADNANTANTAQVALVANSVTWANVSGKPTTISGYGFSDLTVTSPASSDILRWNGTKWVNSSLAAAGIQPAGSYLTANQTLTISGDASGSGTTALTLTLAASGVTAGTYNNSATALTPFTVDAKGRITATSGAMTITPAWASITGKPTTLAGYGITDAQALDADLTAIAALVGTSGFLKKTAANTWSLDTSTYLTANQSITISGDVTGSGTTSIALTLANSGATAGTYNNLATSLTPFTVDAKGRITATGSAVTITPAWSSITGKPTTLSGYGITDAVSSSLIGAASGVAPLDSTSKIPSSYLPSYVDDVLEYAALANFPASGETGKIYIDIATSKIYRWTGSVYVEISPTAGNSDTATKLAIVRTISVTGDATWSVSFDGSANATGALTLASSGVTAGTYNNSATAITPYTVDSKGRITATGTAVTITPAWSSITGKPTALSSFSNDVGYVTSSGSVSYATTSGLLVQQQQRTLQKQCRQLILVSVLVDCG
jgi:type IV secretory pathway TrbF-like protein